MGRDVTNVIPLLAISSVGSAVEFCWAAGEAVLVPYLSRHGVKQLVSTIYLGNPVSISVFHTSVVIFIMRCYFVLLIFHTS